MALFWAKGMGWGAMGFFITFDEALRAVLRISLSVSLQGAQTDCLTDRLAKYQRGGFDLD